LRANAEGAAGEVSSALILLDQAGELAVRAAWPPEDVLDAAGMTAARWSFTYDEPAGPMRRRCRGSHGSSSRCELRTAASA